MASLGSLVVDLALESANFMQGMRNAAAQSNRTASAIQSSMNLAKGAIGGLAGVLSVDFLKDQTMAAFDYADAIVDLSDRTGASTGMLQEFRYAAQMSGSSVESADAAIQKFAKNLGSAQAGNKAMRDTFKELGVEIDQGVDPALRQFMDGVSKMPTIAMRQAKATEIMGKSAGDLTVLLGSGSQGFDTLAQAAEGYGIVLEDNVLRNAGQVNDKLDTMRMILTAQMAGAIIQNADALVALANGFMAAATAAASFFGAMKLESAKSVANGIDLNSDLTRTIPGFLSGKSRNDIALEGRAEVKTTSAGRQWLLTDIANRYNAKLRAGADPKSIGMLAMRAEGQQIRDAEARSKLSLVPPKGERIKLPPVKGSGKSKTAKSANLKSDMELDLAWRREFLNMEGDIRDAMADLENTPQARSNAKVEGLRDNWSLRASQIDNDTGSDQEVREGKKRYTEAQAAELHVLEQSLFNARYDLEMRERDSEIAKDALEVRESSFHNDLDLLNSQASLARSNKERRDIALRIVDKEYELERIQLEAVMHSATASKAEKDIADARLQILGTLRANAVQNAKDQTAGPLEQYLKKIPQTAGEINDQMEQVAVDGVQNLENGLFDVIKGTQSVGDAFKSMVGGILDGLLKIAIQQAIIKPLGSLLFGGGDSSGSGGGGILGSILGSVIKGARANGGMTAPGNYLVGERGPEIVGIGANANVMNNRATRGLAGANDNGGISININGPITSNDPEMVRRMIYEGVMAATPLITKQASDRTISELQRRKI